MALTAKQQLFVNEYLVDLNATQAAIRAGYSEKTANEQGAQNLAKLSIKKEIEKRMKEREERTELTQDKVLKDLETIKQHAMKIGYDAQGNAVMNNYPSALKACELQAKHLGMFVERTEVEHKGGMSVDIAPKLSKEEWMKAHGLGTASGATK